MEQGSKPSGNPTHGRECSIRGSRYSLELLLGALLRRCEVNMSRAYDIDIRENLTEIAKRSEGDEDGRVTYLATTDRSGYWVVPSVHTVEQDHPDHEAYGETIGKVLQDGIEALMKQDAWWAEIESYYEGQHREDLYNAFVDVEVQLESIVTWPRAGYDYEVTVRFVTEIGTTERFTAGYVFIQTP